MKKIFCSIFTVGMLCLTVSCSHETVDVKNGTAQVMVDLGADLSFEKNAASGKSVTRAIDETLYKEVENYQVTLTKSETGESVHSALYKDWELAYQVEAETQYTLTATYGEDVSHGFDKLFVKGSQTFSVASGDSKVVSMTCKPANAKLSLVYKGNNDSDTFEDYFQNCQVSVQTPYMTEAFTMDKSNVGQELYLKTEEGTQMTLGFTITGKDGQTVTVEGFENSKIIDILPCHSYVLTIRPSVNEIEGGKFGLTVTVDNQVHDEEVTINIPGEFLK